MKNSFQCVFIASFGLFSTFASTFAYAGGLERGGYNIDLLFDPGRSVAEVSSAHVIPNRKLKNATLVDSRTIGAHKLSSVKTALDSVSYWVPRVGFKFSFSDKFDCMADYSQPWGAHSKPGINWVGAIENIETQISSTNLAATCSVKSSAGHGNVRFIAGVFRQEISGFKESFVPFSLLAPSIDNVPVTGIGRLDLSGAGFGWRAGVAYEMPDIALRVSLVYNSRVNLNNSGTLDTTNILFPVPGAQERTYRRGVVQSIYGSSSMPDTLELKLQSGISNSWLAFGSIKWVNWSILQSLPFCVASQGSGNPCTKNNQVTSLDLLYRDGLTVSAGIGHRLSEKWNGALQASWDRGVSTGFGTLTDVLSLGGKLIFSPSKNYELGFGAGIGLLSSGKSLSFVKGSDGVTYKSKVIYDFDNDSVVSFIASFKLRM